MAERTLFERTLASLHDAVLDDSLWPAASGLIDEACASKGNMLITGDGASSDDIDIYFARACYRGQRRKDVEDEFFRIYHPVDERVPRIRGLPDSKVVHVNALYTEEEKKTSLAYNEGLAAADTRDSLNVRLDGQHGSRIVWAVADPVDGRGWPSARVRTVRRLLPHLRQYVRVRQTLANARALGASSAALLENTRCGVIQLDRRGRIVAANDYARALLRQGDGLADEGGFLLATDLKDDEALQRLLARAVPCMNAQVESGSMSLNRTTVSSGLLLHAHPVGGARLGARPSRIAVLVLVIDPTTRARIDPALVAAVFGLSPAQSRVAVLLAQGHGIRDIAAVMERGEGTVRWHTKQIYRRLHISGQSELVRLVLSLPDISR